MKDLRVIYPKSQEKTIQPFAFYFRLNDKEEAKRCKDIFSKHN